MKFPDLRKYVFLNVVAFLWYLALVYEAIYHNISFPPYQDYGYGEGPVMSYEQEAFVANIFICHFAIFLSFLLFVIEAVLKFLYNKFIKKFIFKNSNREDVKPVKNRLIRFIVLIYSILFYISLLLLLIRVIA